MRRHLQTKMVNVASSTLGLMLTGRRTSRFARPVHGLCRPQHSVTGVDSEHTKIGHEVDERLDVAKEKQRVAINSQNIVRTF